MFSKYARVFAVPLLAAMAVLGAGDRAAHAQSPSEAEIIRLTNVERQKAGVPPVRPNATITRVAENYAALMAKLDTMSHNLDGNAGGRLAKGGYARAGTFNWGENIAFNYPDAASVVQGWMSDEGHKRNLLDPNFTEIGVGVVNNANGQPYYDQVFARPSGQ